MSSTLPTHLVILNAYPHIVVATITEALGPVDRGAIYAEPIDTVLTTARIGTVTGGGSQFGTDGVVAFVDVEVALADLSESLDRLRELLQQLGAPAGSVLTFTRDSELRVINVATGEPADSPLGGSSAFDRRLVTAGLADTAPPPHYDPAIIRQTAEKVRASYQTLFVDSFPVGVIDRDAYPPAHFAWYDERSRDFARHGFDALGDLKNVADAARPEPGAQPFARRFVTRDQLHRADIFQVPLPDGANFIRVMNVVTELSNGFFVWTCTAAQRWDTPPHILITYVSPDISVDALLAGHTQRVAAQCVNTPGVSVTRLASLQDVLDSENRCQARSAAFRRRQRVPSLAELVRLGSEPHLAALVHAELERMVSQASESAAALAARPDGDWSVTTVELPTAGGAPMPFETLIQYALDQGTSQVREAGSPLNPFLVYDTGRAHFFVALGDDADPIEIALQTLHTDTVQPSACALVIDTRITTSDGKKYDAIVAMASERSQPTGVTWAQAYRPKGLFRSFKVLPFREQVATSRSLFAEAPAHV